MLTAADPLRRPASSWSTTSADPLTDRVAAAVGDVQEADAAEQRVEASGDDEHGEHHPTTHARQRSKPAGWLRSSGGDPVAEPADVLDLDRLELGAQLAEVDVDDRARRCPMSCPRRRRAVPGGSRTRRWPAGAGGAADPPGWSAPPRARRPRTTASPGRSAARPARSGCVESVAAAPDERAKPGRDQGDAGRLGEEVVGAGVEQVDLVVLARLGR